MLLLALCALAFAAPAQDDNMMAKAAEMMKDPAMKKMIVAQQKMMVEQMYAGAPIPAQKADALKKILLDRQIAAMDAALPAMSGGTMDAGKLASLGKNITAQYEGKIKALLTASEYKAFKDYESTLMERMEVQMFKAALPANLALTPKQEKDLIAAMVQERKANPMLAGLKDAGDLSQLTSNGPKLLKALDDLSQHNAKRAASILNAEQLDAFKNWQEQTSAMQSAALKQFLGKNATTEAPEAAAPAAAASMPDSKPAETAPTPAAAAAESKPQEQAAAVPPAREKPASAEAEQTNTAPAPVVEIDPVMDSLSDSEKSAITEGKKWLTHIDRGEYTASWRSASLSFQMALTDGIWSTSLEAARKPLGTLVSRKLKSTQQTTSLPGAPDGHYMLMQFDSAFSAKKNAIETVTVVLQPDGSWRPAGYFIQ